ncbi:uncharacterized protein BO97DRAFT_44532 [Aspergillus homomorphus CBS 101889]|uniref:Uncharacterized protein n=1 Tax=Aspergillus homomorphus (strain CBS 101889) TaxID=1450537 RepID=A0A395I426_ASPHC|nr:hypothetical protein BO97DRAFT_44532 [Aspergillus homomorphus CBS 101889]RAL13154.1 hypothetical protein BO97DRAFT_44532 [Aspergillus homomorphus CBS 101889]
MASINNQKPINSSLSSPIIRPPTNHNGPRTNLTTCLLQSNSMHRHAHHRRAHSHNLLRLPPSPRPNPPRQTRPSADRDTTTSASGPELMLEPRGHDDMYGAMIIPETELVESGAAPIRVLFTHNGGF